MSTIELKNMDAELDFFNSFQSMIRDIRLIVLDYEQYDNFDSYEDKQLNVLFCAKNYDNFKVENVETKLRPLLLDLMDFVLDYKLKNFEKSTLTYRVWNSVYDRMKETYFEENY